MPADLPPGPDAPPTDELDSAEATLGVLQNVLHGIANDELSKRTPCSQFDVAQLTDHLMNSITSIGGAVGAEFPERDRSDSVARQALLGARAALDASPRAGKMKRPPRLWSASCRSNSWSTLGITRLRPHAGWRHPIRCPTTCSAWREPSSHRRAGRTSASTTPSNFRTTQGFSIG